MADRVIYKLTEYNSSTGEEKIFYSHLKQDLEIQLPTVSEDQEITKIILTQTIWKVYVMR